MKKLIYILITILTTFTLVSCIKPPQNLNPHGEIYVDKEWDMFESGHLVNEPITINYWSANSAVDHQGLIQATLVDKFNAMQKELYPDSAITVVPAFQGGYNIQNQKLQAALMGNNNPEIAMVGVSSFSLYKEVTIDMREIFTYDEIRNIFEGFLQFAMYEDKFIGYPYFAATNAYIVNKDRWNTTDVAFPDIETMITDPENSPWTWDLLEEVVSKMKTVENGETRYGLATTGIPIYESLFTQGFAPYDPNATKAIFNNEAGLKTFEYWQNLAKNKYMLNPVEDPNHGTKIQASFSNGEIGMLFASSSGFQAISRQVDGAFELEVLPNPRVTNFYSNQSGGGLIVFSNKSTARQRAAVEFLRWMQADDQVVEFATNAGYLPTTYSSTETDAWKAHSENYPIMNKTIQLMRIVLPEGLEVPRGRAKQLADTEFANYSKGIYYDNFTRPPQQVLNETFDRVNSVLDQNK